MYTFQNLSSIQKKVQTPIQGEKKKKQQFFVPERLLERYHDKSFISYSEITLINKKSVETWYILLKKFGKISPESKVLLMWNILVLISIMFNFYEIPISMFFTDAVYQSEFTSPIGIVINTIFTICLFVNTFFIRPFTLFYHEGKLILKRRDIFKRYFKLEFWLNLVALISLLVYVLSGNHKTIYAKPLFYLMALKLFRTNNMITNKIQIFRVVSSLYKLISLLSILLLLLVWIASIFFAIDYYFYLQKNQYFPVNLWLTNTQACQSTGPQFIDIIATYGWIVWFNYSMYWVLQTVTGVGYGDITPRNPIQVAYCDTVIVVFCLFYALFLNSVWQIIKDLIGRSQKSKKKIIKYYERNYQIQKQILVKLENYAFFNAKTKERQQKQKIINEKLSDDLRSQLLKAKQNKFFSSINFFNELSCLLFSQYGQFLFDLIAITKQSRFGQGQTIALANKDSASLSNIWNGEIILSYPSSKLKKTISQKDKHRFFCALDFFRRKNSSYTVVTSKYSKICQISQEDYLQKLRKNGKAKIQCQYLYEQINIYERYNLASQECWSCNNENHHIYKCPKYFSWLQSYRNTIEILKLLKIKKDKVSFRIYFPRKATNYNKIYQGKCSDKVLNKRLYKINTSQELRLKLEDKIEQKSKNLVDKVQSYAGYRQKYNL